MKRLIASAVLATLCFMPGSSFAAEYTFSLNLPIPPVHNRWQHALKPWFDELSKRSGGRIVVEPYFAEALSKQSEAMDSVRNGVADFAEAPFAVAMGQFPFHERIFDAIDIGDSMDAPNDLLRQMQKDFPKVMKEVDGVKLLFTHALPGACMLATKKPVASLEDLKGLKINVIGGSALAERLKALGASVVSIPVSDTYMALEQGVIDGTTADFQLMVARRFGDIVKHITLLALNGGPFYVVMNKDSYDSLPPDLQKVVDDMAAEGPARFGEFWATDQYNSLQTWLTKMGGTLHLLTPEEYAEAARRISATDESWVRQLDAAGYPGKDMLKRLRELEKQFSSPWARSRTAQYVK